MTYTDNELKALDLLQECAESMGAHVVRNKELMTVDYTVEDTNVHCTTSFRLYDETIPPTPIFRMTATRDFFGKRAAVSMSYVLEDVRSVEMAQSLFSKFYSEACKGFIRLSYKMCKM